MPLLQAEACEYRFVTWMELVKVKVSERVLARRCGIFCIHNDLRTIIEDACAPGESEYG
jgi:hypothetical protein